MTGAGSNGTGGGGSNRTGEEGGLEGVQQLVASGPVQQCLPAELTVDEKLAAIVAHSKKRRLDIFNKCEYFMSDYIHSMRAKSKFVENQINAEQMLINDAEEVMNQAIAAAEKRVQTDLKIAQRRMEETINRAKLALAEDKQIINQRLAQEKTQYIQRCAEEKKAAEDLIAVLMTSYPDYANEGKTAENTCLDLFQKLMDDQDTDLLNDIQSLRNAARKEWTTVTEFTHGSQEN